MESNINLENNKQKKIKLDFKESKYATGRRKKSIARIWINHQTIVLQPLEVVKRTTEFDVRCLVKGGGLSGQAGAIIHGISRALLKYEPELKSILKKEKLTTRDSRSVERKKYGHKKARRSFQFSKR